MHALAIVGALAATSPALASATSPPAVTAKHRPPRPDKILSNETTYTTWTTANAAVAIRVAPSPRAAEIRTLQFETPDAEAIQSYLLLRERWTHWGPWIELRIPMRPNGRTGWVPRSALGSFEHNDMQIIVDRAARRLTLYRAGREIFEAPVGVGKPSTPTPPGHFWITEAFPSTDPFYGPYAFGTSDYAHDTDFPDGSIVGLHGTNEPRLVPGDPSHGCVRLHNSDIVHLESIVTIGTPLLIQ